MTTLSAPAQSIIDQLTAPDAEPGEDVVGLLVPFGLPGAERALLLRHHTAVLTELRDAGWAVSVTVGRAPNGEIHAIGLDAADDAA